MCSGQASKSWQMWSKHVLHYTAVQFWERKDSFMSFLHWSRYIKEAQIVFFKFNIVSQNKANVKAEHIGNLRSSELTYKMAKSWRLIYFIPFHMEVFSSNSVHDFCASFSFNIAGLLSCSSSNLHYRADNEIIQQSL